MKNKRFPRPNWFDFQKVYRQDVNSEQDFHLNTESANFAAIAGSGVLLERAQETVIFDSDNLSAAQAGYNAINAFDGRGILATPFISTDTVEGKQLSITIENAKLEGILTASVIVLGKTFDHSLVYEILEFPSNITELTKNHFIEVTNILFQNLRGNANTLVDGYGSFNISGHCVIREASAMEVSRDGIVNEQIDEPNIVFRDFKTYNSGKTLQTVIEEAIGPSNDINDLNINTTAALSRTFDQGSATNIIYGQKFLMKGTNIQKISVLLSLQTGSSWTGTLVVGIRPLQTTQTCVTNFLPDNKIGFDPDTIPIEEVTVDAVELASRGVILSTKPQIVDFVFTGSNISNPTLSGLVDGEYYILTIRRTGSTSSGTLSLEEARNIDPNKRLTVFENNVWTDIIDSTLWYRIWNDSTKISTGTAYVNGLRLAMEKTAEINGVLTQTLAEDLNCINTGEGAENYLIVQNSIDFINTESHPRTGDPVFIRKEDIPLFSFLEQNRVNELIDAEQEPILLARAVDRNPRLNPSITGTITHPALVLGNTITIINPGSDLLNNNVVGSTIIPNTGKPAIEYRIIKQTLFNDLYGDTDNDGDVDVFDASRVTALDGYGVDLSSGTVAAATQLQAVLNGVVTVPELIRANVNNTNTFIDSTDLSEVNAFINNGTGFTAGSSFVRMELEVEPILDPMLYLDGYSNSTLNLEVADPDLILNTPFVNIDFLINFKATWGIDNLELVDLRRFINTTFLDFKKSEITSSPETGGKNNLFATGDVIVSGNVIDRDGTFHALDYEENTIEIELPSGKTEGEINIFTNFVQNRMQFSDGTSVPSTALNNNQVKFKVSLGSHVKNTFSLVDGYVDYDGYGDNAEEAIGTYMEHNTGILRVAAYHIVNNVLFPQLRTRILVSVSLKKAGFANSARRVEETEFTRLFNPMPLP